MNISFEVYRQENYFIGKYFGRITADYLLASWREFLASDQWQPGLNELTDLSHIDASLISGYTLEALADFIEKVYSDHGVDEVRVAVYAPNDLPYGMSRMYEVYSQESPELVKVFRDKQQAINWLLES